MPFPLLAALVNVILGNPLIPPSVVPAIPVLAASAATDEAKVVLGPKGQTQFTPTRKALSSEEVKVWVSSKAVLSMCASELEFPPSRKDVVKGSISLPRE